MIKSWSDLMDWALLCSMFVMIVGFFIDIYKRSESTETLSKEHSKLSDGHKSLNKTIKEQRQILKRDTDFIIHQNETQAEALGRIDKELYGEIQKRNLQFENLTVNQKDAYEQLQKFTFLFEQVAALQTELKNKDDELLRLKEENRNLNEELAKIKSRNRKLTRNDDFVL